MDVDVRLINYQRVLKAIENLKDFEKDKVVKKGLSDSTKIFIGAGKSNLSSRLKNKGGKTGNLIKSFRTKLKRNKLGALAGFSGKGAHSHLIDSGTDIRTTKKGYNRGKVIGNRFWTDAITNNQSKAIDRLYTSIDRAIEKLIMKK